MRPFTIVGMVILALAAIVQAARFFMGWDVVINGMMIPMWFSGLAAVVLAVVVVMLWREHGSTWHGPLGM